MTHRSTIFAISLLLLPQMTAADIVPINLGEQGDYTRLVLTLPVTEGWRVATFDRALEISVPTATGFDTSAATDLAGSRIASVTAGADNSALRVTLNCDCTASSYVLGGKFLTIDLVGQLTNDNALPEFSAVSGLAQPWHAPLAQSFAATPNETAMNAATLSADPETTRNTLDSAVSTGIASATYQGFLTISPDALVQQGDGSTVSPDILDSIAIGVESQLSTLDAQETTLPDVAVFGCKDVSAQLSEAWQMEHSFSIERATIHTRMISSEDDPAPNDDATLDMAMLLVGQGLGYEALSLLNNLPDNSDLVRSLVYIATIIDKPTAPDLIGLENCQESLAFWAYLHGAGQSDVVDALDPRRLMLTFKLLPEPLQNRMLTQFGDALARAGHESYQAELQDFKNTYFAISFVESGAPAPEVDFEDPASPKEILRAELTERDLDPTEATPNDPTRLTLTLLEGLLLERRGTAAEPALLDAVLDRHVADGTYVEVLSLLIDSADRIEQDVHEQMVMTHLGKSVEMMSPSELLAFAFRSDLPDLPDMLRAAVAARLTEMDVRVPPAFASAPIPTAPAETEPNVQTELAAEVPAFTLPDLVDLPDATMPSFAQSEELLAGSEAVRNAIETLIDDIN